MASGGRSRGGVPAAGAAAAAPRRGRADADGDPRLKKRKRSRSRPDSARGGEAGPSGRQADGDASVTRPPRAAGPAAAPGPVRAGDANWKALRAQLPSHSGAQKRRKTAKHAGGGGSDVAAPPAPAAPGPVGDSAGPTRVVAIDCEMVGVGPEKTSALAHVVVVNNEGHVLLDEKCRPERRITDYRTRFSGLRPRDLRDAPPFRKVRERVADLLRGRVVVGHAVHNDFKALQLTHPPHLTRDTACYPPLMTDPASEGKEGKPRPRSLRALSEEVLGLSIQSGSHSPVEDARCALYLYHRHRLAWEAAIKRGEVKPGTANARGDEGGAKGGKGRGGKAGTGVGVKGGRVVKNAVGRKMSKKKLMAGMGIQERPELYDM